MSGEIQIIMTNLLFGLSYALTRRFENEFSIIFINAVRSIVGLLTFVGGAIILNIFPYVFQIQPKLILPLIGSITFTVIIGDSLFLQGQKYIGSVYATGLSSISPFFTMIFAILFLDEEFSIVLLLSASLIFIGIIILNSTRTSVNLLKTKKNEINSNLSCENSTNMASNAIQNNKRKDQSKNKMFGIFFCISAAFTWSLGIILTDYSMKAVEATFNLEGSSVFVSNIIRYFFASLILTCFSLKHSLSPIKHAKHSWGLLILSAIIGVSFGAYFFTEAARIAGSTILSIASTALPLFIIPFAYIINKEKINLGGFFGILITIGGVLLLLL